MEITFGHTDTKAFRIKTGEYNGKKNFQIVQLWKKKDEEEYHYGKNIVTLDNIAHFNELFSNLTKQEPEILAHLEGAKPKEKPQDATAFAWTNHNDNKMSAELSTLEANGLVGEALYKGPKGPIDKDTLETYRNTEGEITHWENDKYIIFND
jgi:hypothetical protein